MVVLSAAVLSRNGKALVARQFVEMSRMRIEGLLAAFPKLIGGGSTQHTFVETESVRYVYQPVETLYLLLITNKGSNIVEDLDTLRLLSKVLSEVAGGLTPERVSNAAFEIVFAFDEAIAVGGFKESVNLRAIQTNLEMESHEEKLALLIKRDHELQAKKDAAAKAAEIRERNRNAQRNPGSGGMQGIGGGMGGGIGGGIGSDSYSSSNAMPPPATSAPAPEPAPRRSEPPRAAARGMKLGGGGRMGNTLAQLAAEANLAPEMLVPRGPNDAAAQAVAAAQAAAQAPQAAAYPLTLSVEEKLSVRLSREGVVEAMEVWRSTDHAMCRHGAASTEWRSYRWNGAHIVGMALISCSA
uniref:Coatomer subunit delta n=1 Tax=Pinguiococcus pyrenoidosus TaxID=172671 RepID=A0A7R9YGD8_9STRA|mmetsp:Transcript_8719/g.32866  ORF Transcript_8719/g.32866 Transcript_8719/m.32866 type:complete len:355 (+) Transcript_8719:237-1301(+)